MLKITLLSLLVVLLYLFIFYFILFIKKFQQKKWQIWLIQRVNSSPVPRQPPKAKQNSKKMWEGKLLRKKINFDNFVYYFVLT